MEYNFFIQVIINGLMIGFLYVLIALGFTLIFSISRVFNFAHGELYMLGAFATYFFYEELHVFYFCTIIISMLLIALLGLVIERYFFRPVRGNMYASFMIALGLNLFISNAAQVVFGNQMRDVSTVFPGTVKLFGATVSFERSLIIVSCALVTVLLQLLVKRTKVGIALRSVAQDAEVAALHGININQTNALSFGIASAIAAAAGAIVVPALYVDPFIGGPAMFKAMIVVILGGLGSIPGAVVGGLFLGFIESIGLTFVGNVANLFGWISVIILLLFRPQGILGKES